MNKFFVSSFRWVLSALLLVFVLTAAAFADDMPIYQDKNPLHYEVSTTEPASAPLASLAQKITKTVNGITFDSNYDNGSLLDITSTGANTFSGSLYVEPGVISTSKYWFRFRMTGIAGRTITINLDHTQNPRPVISYDSVTWRRMTSTEAPTTSRMVLTFGSTTNFAEVAFFYPMGYGETFSKVSSLVLANPYGTITVIGQSYQGRNMLMVTVTDTTVPNTGKHRVWFAFPGACRGSDRHLLHAGIPGKGLGKYDHRQAIAQELHLQYCPPVKLRWCLSGSNALGFPWAWTRNANGIPPATRRKSII